MLEVVLTGASSGIGLESTRLLLNKGYKVYALSRKSSTIKELDHPNCTRIDCDLQDQKQIEQAAHFILKQSNVLFALINNAGYGLFGALEEQEIQQAKALFQTNLFGLARLSALLLPKLRTNATLKPKIINVASSAGRSTTLFLGWYHASKYALEGYSDCLRAELLPLGVSVILIEPGAIKTKWDEGLSEPAFKGVYAKELEKTHAFFKQVYASASPASEVANTLIKALESPNPKTRYLVGKYAYLLVYGKKFLPDKIYDRFMRWFILR
ncbi:SDR family NAD(P)-dependent oxidoreductase [Helicobacter suis]|uniref:SDR family NAD(P)-dependent oxidoreductase n=1 Tax=Helicobacter suis TaxID=104628 RepID=UPI001F07550B|nr:SDR family NAD(P)-dependent oxidoreductase [Helicobacter suis]